MLIDVGKKVVVDILFIAKMKLEFLHMYVIVIILALMSVFNTYFHMFVYLCICMVMHVYVLYKIMKTMCSPRYHHNC